MVKFIFENLPKFLTYIWDEKYVENIFGFDMIYIEFGLDLKTRKRKGFGKKKEKLLSHFGPEAHVVPLARFFLPSSRRQPSP